VPAARVVPFRSDLDWTTLGALPVMLQTASGSLTIALDAKESQSLPIRGGTSSVGMATAVLAKRLGILAFRAARVPAGRRSQIQAARKSRCRHRTPVASVHR
jgi:NADPH:quinone reductase